MILLPSCKLLKLQSKLIKDQTLDYTKYVKSSEVIKKWRNANYEKDANEFEYNVLENSLYGTIKHWLLFQVFDNPKHRNLYFTDSIKSKIGNIKNNIPKFCEALSNLDKQNCPNDEDCLSGTIFIDNNVQYHYMVGDNRLIACVTTDLVITYFESLTIIPNYEKRKRDFYIEGYKVTSPIDYPNCENRVKFGVSKHQGFLTDMVVPLLSILYFAEIETKTIQSESKTYLSSHKEVRNSTNLPIEVINSNWFTTIIRTNGFGVNGHFRFQSCGEGMKDHKLIWINAFEKQGYTRIAGKELSKVA